MARNTPGQTLANLMLSGWLVSPTGGSKLGLREAEAGRGLLAAAYLGLIRPPHMQEPQRLGATPQGPGARPADRGTPADTLSTRLSSNE